MRAQSVGHLWANRFQTRFPQEFPSIGDDHEARLVPALNHKKESESPVSSTRGLFQWV